MLAPPLFPGAVNVIVACPLPAVAVPIVGASGTVAGAIELDALDGVLVPSAFVAVTVNVYAWPFVSPVTVSGEPLPVAVSPPTFEVTVYDVVVEPSLKPGVNVIVAEPLPRTAVTLVGASGTLAGVTEFEALDTVLVPIAFVAVTVNVYAVPFDSPVTVSGEPLPLAVNPPVLEATVYDVIAVPPLFKGGVKVIVACPFPAVATPIVGASGTPSGTIELLVPDGVLVPTEFVAVTVKV